MAHPDAQCACHAVVASGPATTDCISCGSQAFIKACHQLPPGLWKLDKLFYLAKPAWCRRHGGRGGAKVTSVAVAPFQGGVSCACRPSMVLLPWQQVTCSPKLRVPYQQDQPTLTGGSRCAELLGAPPATHARQSGAMYSLRGQPASPRISSRAGVCSLGHTGRQAGRQAGRRQAGRQVMPPSDLRGTKGMRRQSRQAPLPNDKHRTILKYITCTVS